VTIDPFLTAAPRCVGVTCSACHGLLVVGFRVTVG
jgi:hypothetical protein